MPDLSGHADLVTTTKADGTYEMTLPDGSFSLAATHDDYTQSHKRIELAGKPITVDFSLIPGAVLRGQVVARDSGKPVPGALVRAEGGHDGTRGDGMTAMSDENGNFLLRSLGSGTLELSALGRGYATATPTVVSVGIGEQVEGVRVLVDRAYSISGKVVRKGKPDEGLPGITLGAFSIAAKAFGIALEPSAKDGSFEIVGLKPAAYMLFAVGEGSVPEVGKNVEVVDKDVEGVVVEIGAGATVAGRVEPPMAGAEIHVEMAGQVGFANMFDAAKLMLVHGETDASGAFTLHNVPAGSFKVKAMAQSGPAGEQPVLVADADVSGVVVKLDPRASVSGRVVDSNGAPIAGGRVDVDSLEEKNMSMSFGPGRRDRATTAPDGTFKIVGLDAGKVRVRASDGDDNEFVYYMTKKNEPSKSAAELTLIAGKETPNVNLTVDARDGTIRGTVMTNDGKPAPDAWVTAQRVIEKDPAMPERAMRWMGGSHPPVLTGSDGQFTITKLRKGTYNLSIEGPKGTSHAEKEGVKLGENVTITLAQLGTLSGKVTLQGAPVATFDIECHSAKDDDEKHVDDKTGAYFIDRLTPGSYKCSIDSDKGTANATVEVPAGPMQQDFKLTGWATVTGVVVNVLTKQPVAGVTAFAGTDNWSSRNMNDVMTGHVPTTDASGRFVVERVAVGKGKVAIMPKDSFQPLGQRDYTAAESQRVDVGTIEIIPPRNGDAGTFGMTTVPDGDKLMVVAVRDGGPAAAAGVQIGDRVMQINGRDVAQLTPLVGSQLLASGSIDIGQTVQLTLDRAGAKVEATVTSVKW